ncbi:hypothetical protein GSI_02570 [Ganoderma sinense ZZ0214-1]|uniref:Protein kinase domain-containing protein n=1 Tax=Ganoderma sinense ZZ0214-1 TaxID=1077348 RepID=A0A2G8SM31_9APHY|nr:hypothetical protein GSI_02570 [Ganoderma sinense ZZ0214-1]
MIAPPLPIGPDLVDIPDVLNAPALPTPKATISKVPDWLLTHPELHKRGITLRSPLQPPTVYMTKRRPEEPVYVVKVVDPSRLEVAMYDLLDQHSDSPTDHTIPHEVIRCEPHLVVMPYASPIEMACNQKTSSILAAFDQILEGVEHMHRLRIAHMDIFSYNVVAAIADDAARDARLKAGRVYLIDFESCQQFEHGPGVQTAVPLPGTHVAPPLKMKSFDPFSWDVYCLGRTLEDITQDIFAINPDAMPKIPHMFARWLKGNEVGLIVRWVVNVAELVSAIVTYPMTFFRTPVSDSEYE